MVCPQDYQYSPAVSHYWHHPQRDVLNLFTGQRSSGLRNSAQTQSRHVPLFGPIVLAKERHQPAILHFLSMYSPMTDFGIDATDDTRGGAAVCVPAGDVFPLDESAKPFVFRHANLAIADSRPLLCERQPDSLPAN